MAQQFDYPKTDTDLRKTSDELYQSAKSAFDEGKRPTFKGIIEIMSAEATIVTAIHNIKSNKGSYTPGTDKRNMKYYLSKPYEWVIQDIQQAFTDYQPQKIRRVYIDKPGKIEKRPLGIPSIRDRIVQECMRIVLEPILEAQFFGHSYGFRPMRDTHMASYRISNLVHLTGYYWVVEGDISKCFDKIDHSILLKRLFHMGIKDRRVLQIIKTMLKAGVAGECDVNEYGTPQGGILSPLLANVYMDIMDEWVSSQWERKKTKTAYTRYDIKITALRERSNLIPGYLVRYADDFVIITDSRLHAELWKQKIQEFLQKEMRLTLSLEKTAITDVRKNHIHFLGYEYKVVRGKSRTGYITRTRPDRERLKLKVDSIAKAIKEIPPETSREQAILQINLINSQIRGLINYYENCTRISNVMDKHAHRLQRVGKKRLKQYNGIWVQANKTRNLMHVHSQYKTKIPAIKFRDIYIGFTSLSFCRWNKPFAKIQDETPYNDAGRVKYLIRTKKTRQNARLDEAMSERLSTTASMRLAKSTLNFEFVMNRAYALNRDRFKCRACGRWLYEGTLYTHQINPHLPLDKVNKVSNLASMHQLCFHLVHDLSTDISHIDSKTRWKIKHFREQLVTKAKKTL